MLPVAGTVIAFYAVHAMGTYVAVLRGLRPGAPPPDGTSAESRLSPRGAVGPDFDRLFLGSRGKLGIVHEATLRILPASARVLLTYAARDLSEALVALKEAYDRGLTCRSAEVITPTPDRAWGSKRMGLGSKRPVLVVAEPWGRQAAVSRTALDDVLSRHLERLEPPVGWNTHEGLLPPVREWKAPVVGVTWRELAAMARGLDGAIPPGLWIVRISPNGAWLSIADDVSGPEADEVRTTITGRRPPSENPWMEIARVLRKRLDPNNVLNPS